MSKIKNPDCKILVENMKELEQVVNICANRYIRLPTNGLIISKKKLDKLWGKWPSKRLWIKLKSATSPISL